MVTNTEQNSIIYRNEYDYALNVTGIPDFTKMKTKTVSVSGHVLSETVFQRINDVKVKPGERVRVKAAMGDNEALYVIWKPEVHKEAIEQESYQYRVRGISKYGMKSRWLYSAIYKPSEELLLGLLITEFADIISAVYDDEISLSTQHILEDMIIAPLLEKDAPKIAKLFPQKENLSYNLEELLARIEENDEALSIEEQVVADILQVIHLEKDQILQHVKEEVHITLEDVFRMGYKLKADDNRVSEIFENEIKSTLLKSIYDVLELSIADKPVEVALYQDKYLALYTETVEELILNGKEALAQDYELLIVERAKGLMKTSFSLMLDFWKEDISIYQASDKIVATYAATLEDIAIITKYDELVERTLYQEILDLLDLDIKENPIQYTLFDENGTALMELAYELLHLLKQEEVHTDLRKTLLDRYVTGHNDSYIMTIQKLVDDLLLYNPTEKLTLGASIGLIGSNSDKNNFDWLLYEKYQEKYRNPLTVDEVSIQTVEEYVCLYKLVSQKIQENVTITTGDSASFTAIVLASLLKEKERHFSPTETAPLLLDDYVSYQTGYWQSLIDEQVITYDDISKKDVIKKWFSFYEYLVADIKEVPHRLIKALFYDPVNYHPNDLLRMYFVINFHDHYKKPMEDHAMITTDLSDSGFPLGKFVIGTTPLGKGATK